MNNIPLIQIKDLSVSINNKNILSNLNLDINTNSIAAIMGPNGSGKSTLSKVLARHPDYQITNGTILFNNTNLLTLSPEESAWQGIFLSFQYPVSIPGVSNIQFLKTAVNAVRKQQNKPKLDAVDFLKLVKEKLRSIDLNESFLSRSLNDGFSGGEKKRNEILQMLLLEPKFAILDETDSGLDIDALKVISNVVNSMRGKCTFLIITHYQRLLDYIEPDVVHVLAEGKIVHSGNKNLPLELEQRGYTWLETELGKVL